MTKAEIKIELPITTWVSLPEFTPVWSEAVSISRNKTCEVEIYYEPDVLVNLGFSISTNRDHAGVHVWVVLFGVALHASVCDNRHWDEDNNRWYKGEHNEFWTSN